MGRVADRARGWSLEVRERLRARRRRRESCGEPAETRQRFERSGVLRLVTYNIHRAIGVDRRFRPERIALLLAEHDADIVLLQEVDDGVPRSRELNLASELAEALDYPYFSVGHNVRVRTGGRYGNATFSRFPIENDTNIDLTIGRRKRRGCQHTRIALPGTGGGTALEVFNMHLGLSARERLRQIARLSSAPEFAALDPTIPCLAGGDFNDWRSLLRPVFTENLGFLCASDRRTGSGPRAMKTYPSFSPRGGLDKIYFRGGMELHSVFPCRHQIARVASDHLPLVVEFRLSQARGEHR